LGQPHVCLWSDIFTLPLWERWRVVEYLITAIQPEAQGNSAYHGSDPFER